MADKTYRYKLCPQPVTVHPKGPAVSATNVTLVTCDFTIDEADKTDLDRQMKLQGWLFDQEVV